LRSFLSAAQATKKLASIERLPIRKQLNELALLETQVEVSERWELMQKQSKLIQRFIGKIPLHDARKLAEYIREFQAATQIRTLGMRRDGGFSAVYAALWDLHKALADEPTNQRQQLEKVVHLQEALATYSMSHERGATKLPFAQHLGGRATSARRDLSACIREPDNLRHPAQMLVKYIAQFYPGSLHRARDYDDFYTRVIELEIPNPAARVYFLRELFAHSDRMLNIPMLSDFLVSQALMHVELSAADIRPEILTDPLVTQSALYRGIVTRVRRQLQAQAEEESEPAEVTDAMVAAEIAGNDPLFMGFAMWRYAFVVSAVSQESLRECYQTMRERVCRHLVGQQSPEHAGIEEGAAVLPQAVIEAAIPADVVALEPLAMLRFATGMAEPDAAVVEALRVAVNDLQFAGFLRFANDFLGMCEQVQLPAEVYTAPRACRGSVAVADEEVEADGKPLMQISPWYQETNRLDAALFLRVWDIRHTTSSELRRSVCMDLLRELEMTDTPLAPMRAMVRDFLLQQCDVEAPTPA
jgi:hypothetical protein